MEYPRADAIASELSFWEAHLPEGRRHQWMDEMLHPEGRRDQFPTVLLPYIEQIRQCNSGEVHVLDVGCGPLSPLAWGVEAGLIALTAIDPLADHYETMLARLGLSFPVRPTCCSAEELAAAFLPFRFDIEYARNSLDHTADIFAAVQNIRAVLKPDGIFFAEGFVKEGTHTRWTGMHQWDIVLQADGLHVIDQSGRNRLLTEGFFAEWHEQSGDQPGDWFKILLRPKGDA